MKSITFICECCGQEHEEWPALAYSSPDYYSRLSHSDKEEIAVIDQDFCVVKISDDEIHRFIRCVLFQKVNDHCDYLEYGVWVSLSETSFNDYLENFDNQDHEVEYFGWLSNSISDYSFAKSIPTTVVTQKGNSRPAVFPHKDVDHPFVKDFNNGITKTEAEKRIQNMINATQQNG